MIGLPHLGLWSLECRRALTTVAAPTLAFTLALGLLRGASPIPPGLPDPDPALVRGLFREELWSSALMLLVPLAVVRAARIPAAWRRGEADWIGARPLGRGAALASAWAGLATAVLLTLGTLGLAVEARLEGGGSAPEFLAAEELPAVLRVDPGERRELYLVADDLRRAASESWTLRLRTTLLPGGEPTTPVRVSIADESAVEVRVEGRTWIELPLPAPASSPSGSEASLPVTIDNLGHASLVVLDTPGVEFWRQGFREDRAWRRLAARAAWSLACASALALAFATWISPASAAGSALALWLLPAVLPAHPTGWDSLSLLGALGDLRQARVPGAVDLRAVAILALLTGASYLLARRGLRSWRHAP